MEIEENVLGQLDCELLNSVLVGCRKVVKSSTSIQVKY
jgi:hypothetical protein